MREVGRVVVTVGSDSSSVTIGGSASIVVSQQFVAPRTDASSKLVLS